MSRTGQLLFVILFIAATVVGVCAQTADWDKKNEVAGLFVRDLARGHAISSSIGFLDNRVNIGYGYGFQGNYGRRLRVTDLAAFTLEVPVLYLPDQDLLSSNDLVPEGYKALFITPSLRANLFPNTLVSPWVSVGAGFGRFSTSKNGVFNVNTNLPGKSSTTSIFQVGLGLDVKIWKSFKFRAEARDFYSGVPELNVNQGRTRMHNVTGGGGIVWVF